MEQTTGFEMKVQEGGWGNDRDLVIHYLMLEEELVMLEQYIDVYKAP